MQTNTKTSYWSTLNVNVSPEDKEKLFKGEINVFNCANCGHKAGIDAPLMYHDMFLRYSVQYYPSQLLKETDFYDRFASDAGFDVPSGGIPIDDASSYLRKPHICL